MKLEKLTTEQEKKMYEVRDYWLDYIFSCKNGINKEKANIQIEWLYKFCGLNKPIIIYLDSPLGCQFGVQLLKEFFKAPKDILANVRANVWANVWDNVWANVRANVWDNVRANVWANVWDNVWANVGDNVWDNVWANVGDNVWDNVRANVRANVGANVWDNVWANVRANVWANVGANVWANVRANVRANVWDNYERFSEYGSIGDYGWVSFFDFFTQIGVLDHKGFNEFKALLQCGVYDMIQLNGFCIVSSLPTKIVRNSNNRLHCEDGTAIEFKDGYCQYYWNGVCVPDFWITSKASITKEIILKETNAEKRRVLREILGAQKYFELLGGVVVIDKDVDDKGNEMILYKSKQADNIINKYVQYLSVICPSTQRQYILYPPNQESKNVWEAKASTFRNEKIQIRHGDVGLVNLAKAHEKPMMES